MRALVSLCAGTADAALPAFPGAMRVPMTDLFHNLRLGFGVAVSPVNLLLCLIGTPVCSD